MPLPPPGLGLGVGSQAVSQTGTALSPANAVAQFRLNSNGVAQSAPTSGAFSDLWLWLSGVGGVAASNYWARMTMTSGTFNSGDGAGTWLQLNTTRTWGRNRTSDTAGTTTAVATCEIALDSGGANIIATFTVTLSATVVGP